MNIKSLLLGSAAAMVAVSGAQAADAVVVEPEPVEYVRVCDAYGAGFFFIPGTETCMRINGFVRSTMGKLDRDVENSLTGVEVDAVSGDAVAFVNRARVNLDVRNETDLGTLRSIIRFEAGDNNDPSATPYRSDVALVSLAGFRLGQNGANYWSTNHGFAGVNLSAVTFGTDGFYGFDDSMVFDYTWAADGLAITVGVENPTNANLGGVVNGGDFINYYAGFNYSADFGTIAFTALHDSSALETGSSDQGGWAYKASLTLDLSDFVPGGTLHGFYQTDDDYVTRALNNAGLFADVEEAYGVSFQMNLTDEVQFIALWNHAEGGDNVNPLLNEGDADIYTVGMNWFPAATPGLSVRAAYSHREIDETNLLVPGTLVDVEEDAFEITVRRDF